jgi:hypothetical protein
LYPEDRKNAELDRRLKTTLYPEDNENSDDSPDFKRRCQYEACLKSRIFFSDRFEKIERCLLDLHLISKDTCYCSESELKLFQAELSKEELSNAILATMWNEGKKNEVWFELYESVTTNKGLIEKQIMK